MHAQTKSCSGLLLGLHLFLELACALNYALHTQAVVQLQVNGRSGAHLRPLHAGVLIHLCPLHAGVLIT